MLRKQQEVAIPLTFDEFSRVASECDRKNISVPLRSDMELKEAFQLYRDLWDHFEGQGSLSFQKSNGAYVLAFGN